MERISLESEINELIELQAEGEYWDFKKQWHHINSDLIHDIICMANSPANRDCYIIIGVEDKVFNVCGVNDIDRKNQQNVMDLLRQKPKWAGGYIPEVYVNTILISDKEIDIIIIKKSDNTPFYLLEDYKSNGAPIFKGSIYTRKGDANTPKTCTADVHDAELLWKRRFGLIYNPSQRAQNYLTDLVNWERIDGESDKLGISRYFFYYMPDPDYTVHYIFDEGKNEAEILKEANNINDDSIGFPFYYLFSFCNVSYNTDISLNSKIVLFYRDVPLFSSSIESIDEGRTKIIPPDSPSIYPNYIRNSFRYLMFEFVFAHWCGNYSNEARMMFLRVIPLYENSDEYEEFKNYIETKGFSSFRVIGNRISGEALERLSKTNIGIYIGIDEPNSREAIAKELRANKQLVVNFARQNKMDFDKISEHLKIGKMLVDWLDDWRNNQNKITYEGFA